MKKPDEIKKALECCFFDSAQCRECPYYPTTCDRELVRDAREYIQQLEAERDAAVNFLRSMGCDTCMYDDYDGSEPPCINCTAERDYWMWRGVTKEG